MLLVWGDDVTAAPDPTPGYTREIFFVTVGESTFNLPACLTNRQHLALNLLFARIL